MNTDIQFIANYYGIEAQTKQACEELSELIKALLKRLRAEGNKEATRAADGNVIEEIADVEIMIEQIKYLRGITDAAVGEVKRSKILRTVADIVKKGKKNNNDIADEIKRLTAERDAAVEDLKREGGCSTCRYGPESDYSSYPCNGCNRQRTEWQWRGIPPQEGNR